MVVVPADDSAALAGASAHDRVCPPTRPPSFAKVPHLCPEQPVPSGGRGGLRRESARLIKDVDRATTAMLTSEAAWREHPRS